MGYDCCPERKTGNPIIIFNYDMNNLEQKQYIQKFKSYLENEKVIDVNSTQFLIVLSIFSYSHIIKKDNDFNPRTIPKHLTYMKNIINQTIDDQYTLKENFDFDIKESTLPFTEI